MGPQPHRNERTGHLAQEVASSQTLTGTTEIATHSGVVPKALRACERSQPASAAAGPTGSEGPYLSIRWTSYVSRICHGFVPLIMVYLCMSA